MLIAIDGNEANVKNRVGSNEYAFQVLKHLKKQAKSEKLKDKNNNLKFKIYLKKDPLSDLPKQTNWWEYKILKPEFLWTQWRLPLELILNKERPDVFFTPGHYAPRFCSPPLVISIMDLAFLRFPQQFRKRDLYTLINWTKKSVNQANHILTISQFTKKEIIHFYQYPAEKITVTYPGAIKKLKIKNEKLKIVINNLKQKYKIRGKYFLYIGTIQPRKNLIRLIEVFAKTINNVAMKQFNNLVIVGKKGWLYDDIFRKVEQLGLEKRVIFTGFVAEEEKNILLKNAFALVLPSLYEGFGIPVLEAMQLGCPVIVSRTSSLPETAGEAALYIDNPQSVNSIQKTLLKMVKLDENKRKKLIDKGFKQVKKFSWQKTAEKTLKTLVLCHCEKRSDEAI